MTPNHRLRWEREQRSYTCEQIADAIGATISQLENWEQGVKLPPPFFQQALCDFFALDAQALGFPSHEDTSHTVLLLAPRQLHLTGPGMKQTNVLQKNTDSLVDPALPFPHTGNIDLIGRELLFESLREEIKSQGSLALYGLPGVGKTALALALAYDPTVREQFYDGILWAGMGGQARLSTVLSRWGTILCTEMREAPGQRDDWLLALQSAIGTRRFLIVIDDVWNEDDANVLLQVGNASCASILTTRFASIAQHLARKSILISELDIAAGLALLSRWAPAAVAVDPTVAESLVRAVGGLPLAVMVMGKHLGMQSYDHQSRRLFRTMKQLSQVEHRLQVHVPLAPIDHPSCLSPDMTVSIQSVLAVSDRALPPQARRALRALSVLPAKPHSFAEETALVVANVSLDTLSTLCHAGLLERSSFQRYMLHTVIADYAGASLNEQSPFSRLVQHSMHMLDIHHQDLRYLEQNSETILAALEIAQQKGWMGEFIQGVSFFVPFMQVQGWYSTAEKLLLQAYQASMERPLQADERSRERLLWLQGLIAQKQGNYTQAETFYEKGLTHVWQQENQQNACRLLNGLGEVAKERGEYLRAEAYYQTGLLLAQQIKDQEQISTLFKNLGGIAMQQGDYQRAGRYYEDGLVLARQIKRDDLVSTLLLDLGVVAKEQGNYSQAITYYDDALALARQIGHRALICALLSNLGVIADVRGDYAQAETYFQEGLALAQQIGHRERMSLLLLNLGDTSLQQENSAQAKAYFQEGLALACEIGHRERISDFLRHMGVLMTRQSHYFQAEIYLEEGLMHARQIGNPFRICTLLVAWGDLYLQREQYRRAEGAFDEALNLLAPESRALRAQAQFGQAQVKVACGNLQEARRLARASLDLLAALGHRNKQQVQNLINALPEE